MSRKFSAKKFEIFFRHFSRWSGVKSGILRRNQTNKTCYFFKQLFSLFIYAHKLWNKWFDFTKQTYMFIWKKKKKPKTKLSTKLFASEIKVCFSIFCLFYNRKISFILESQYLKYCLKLKNLIPIVWAENYLDPSKNKRFQRFKRQMVKDLGKDRWMFENRRLN